MSDRSLMERITTVKSTVESLYGKGLFAYVKYLYYGLMRVNTFVVFELPLDREFEEKPVGDDVILVKPSREELDRIREGRDLPKAFYIDKTDGITCCYLLLKNGEPVYIHWISYHGDKSRFVRLGKKTTRITYIFTLPEHRGEGYYYKMIPKTANELRKQGIEKLVTVIHDGNISAIKSVTKAGFREYTRIKALGPLNKTIDV
jgi:GNAT superfamily N-acetyltransferase